MNKYLLFITFLFLSLYLTAQEQFRLDFAFYRTFTPTSGQNADGTNKGVWSEIKKEDNSIVFNYNEQKDIALFTSDGNKQEYKRTSEVEELELPSGMKYRLVTALSPKGNEKVIQYLEDGNLRIIDVKSLGMIEFIPTENNNSSTLYLYNCVQTFVIEDEKLVLDKTIPVSVTIKITSEIISVDLGFGEIEYVIDKSYEDKETKGMFHYECFAKADEDDTYLFSTSPNMITMFNDDQGSRFFNNTDLKK